MYGEVFLGFCCNLILVIYDIYDVYVFIRMKKIYVLMCLLNFVFLVKLYFINFNLNIMLILIFIFLLEMVENVI